MNDPRVEKQPPVPPFVQFCCAAIPQVFDDSLSYYEALCAMWKYLNDTVNVINNNAMVTEDFIVKVNELHDYVENYFTNLDVQEEINNKLDQMAEDGTLQEIITTYIQQNVTWTFDTVADMKLATNLIAGSYARTLGFYAIGDGGGATYLISDSGTANEKDVIAVDDLYAIFQPVLPVVPEQLGAYGDDTHDDSSIISYALSTYKSIKLGRKTYLTTSTITIAESKLTIAGDYPAKIHYTGNNQAILINSGSRNKISDIEIYGNASNIGIEFATTTGKADNIIERCRIDNVATGIKTQYAWDMEVKDTRIISTNTPLILGNQTNNISFNSCYFTGFVTSISLTNCEGIKFDGCDIANYTGTSAVISMYQSALTCINCYFENLGDIVQHIKCTDNSILTLINGHASYGQTSLPTLRINGEEGKVFTTAIQGAPISIVNYYDNSDKPACGKSMKSLDLPNIMQPSMFSALTYFDGTFDVTYTSTGTSVLTNQTFADGVMTLQHGASANPQGIKFSISAGKDYLMYIEGETPEDYPNLTMGQIGTGSSGVYNRNIDMSTKRAIVAFHGFGEEFTIRWNHTEDVVIRKLIIVEQ